jgi:cellulose synthase/poly-beta-1,6-N-acetylglucosamine synthase-like glycosyltransferase
VGKEKASRKAGFRVNQKPTRHYRLAYTLFLIPFVLAILSWAYFPTVAQWVTTNIFGYNAAPQPANPVWRAIIEFFYSWYTFLAIGVAGVWITGALLAQQKKVNGKVGFYPMVSFVVPAFNEEANIGPCVRSLCECADKYNGNCEVIVVDDGSTDFTYEAAWRAVQAWKSECKCRVRCKVMRHMINLGKTEALRTGVNSALGQLIAVVDGDSQWDSEALRKLVDALMLNGKKAVTGYIHPQAEGKTGFLISFQQLEYSQGLAIDRCAQSLGNCVLVVPGAIGLYDTEMLRQILVEGEIRSVVEDSEITLTIHKRGARVGYVSGACSSTDAPVSLGLLWRQRLRWFTGWLHNVLKIHGDLFRERSWLSGLLWYGLVFEFMGAFVDLAAVIAFPFLWLFAPDAVNFGLNLIVFAAYGLLIGLVNQAVALKFAYGRFNHDLLLRYTPFYPFLWIINVFARIRSIIAYISGSNGKWH